MEAELSPISHRVKFNLKFHKFMKIRNSYKKSLTLIMLAFELGNKIKIFTVLASVYCLKNKTL